MSRTENQSPSSSVTSSVVLDNGASASVLYTVTPDTGQGYIDQEVTLTYAGAAGGGYTRILAGNAQAEYPATQKILNQPTLTHDAKADTFTVKLTYSFILAVPGVPTAGPPDCVVDLTNT